MGVNFDHEVKEWCNLLNEEFFKVIIIISCYLIAFNRIRDVIQILIPVNNMNHMLMMSSHCRQVMVRPVPVVPVPSH